jgi:phenylalanine-4-hydroxylase
MRCIITYTVYSSRLKLKHEINQTSRLQEDITKMDEMTEYERFLWEELRAANDMMLLNAYLLEDYIDYINAAGLREEFEAFRKVKAQQEVATSN